LPLLKHTSVDRIAGEAVVLDLGDLRQQADAILYDARRLSSARAEAQKLTDAAEHIGREQGQAEGYAQGLEEGRAAGHAEALASNNEQLNQLQQAWIHAAQQWEDQRRKMVLDAEQSVVELALAIAEKVIRRVPRIDPTVVADQVQAAVAYLTHPTHVRLRINPADRPLLEEAMPDLCRALPNLTHVELIDSDDIEPGGCIVSYDQGRIDATLDKQIERLTLALLPGQSIRQTEPTESVDPPEPVDSDDESPQA